MKYIRAHNKIENIFVNVWITKNMFRFYSPLKNPINNALCMTFEVF